MDNKLKYFIYCRKSEEDEERQILSIEAQLRELKEYAQKSNLRVVDILIESKSARKPGREIFDTMIKRIEVKEANAILVWQINRIARNSLDGGRIIWYMDNGTIKQIDTPHKQFKNNGDDKFFMTLEFGMAKKYSDDLSDNIRRGNRQKYERGEYIGWAPLGYINAKIEGHPNILPEQNSSQLTVKVFEEFSTASHSLGTMTNTIEKWGLKTKAGKKISKSHLYTILTNPTYYGWYRHGGDLHKGNYEPLISKQLFDRVQDVLHNRSKPKKIYNDWAYAGLIKCGCECGATVIFETKKKYYKGTGRWAEYTYARSSKRCAICTETGISLKELERQIINKLDDISIDKEVWQLGIKLLEAKYESESKDRSMIVETRQREYQKLQTELDGYFKMRAREEMTADEFQEKKNHILKEQNKLKDFIDNGLQNQRHWLELAEDFFTTALQAREIVETGNLEEKRKIVQKIGWNLKLKSGKLVWTYQKPFDILLQTEVRSNMSRGKDSNL